VCSPERDESDRGDVTTVELITVPRHRSQHLGLHIAKGDDQATPVSQLFQERPWHFGCACTDQDGIEWCVFPPTERSITKHE
jgi:hypothetical protein